MWYVYASAITSRLDLMMVLEKTYATCQPIGWSRCTRDFGAFCSQTMTQYLVIANCPHSVRVLLM